MRAVRPKRSAGAGPRSLGTKIEACRRSSGSGARVSEKNTNAPMLAAIDQKTPWMNGSKASVNSACGRSSQIPNGPSSRMEAGTSPFATKFGNRSV